jgi:uncharacterized protein YbaR (Trm112 family)
MLGPDFLEILRCPENRTRLHEAPAELLAKLNSAVEKRELKNRSGQLVEKSLDGALVREDNLIAYPVIDQIPILLIDEGIRLES